ncbi:hypothetical protein THAOC_21485 [Thalassiosira oceanica]|uniref:Uncharacterized protein n=1 Tax=Thalassiosira oceanica TaxID=159749 RepID=K0SIQ8_THAOC|nr:hypothetical protein THAOC_21485 [Thalassiosira oceanica]|eukprot:EJK58392.1 hypothetical protein THAOC_21485 [Thalassiosira oceanica]
MAVVFHGVVLGRVVVFGIGVVLVPQRESHPATSSPRRVRPDLHRCHNWTKRSFTRPYPRALMRLRPAFPAPLTGSSTRGGRGDIAVPRPGSARPPDLPSGFSTTTSARPRRRRPSPASSGIAALCRRRVVGTARRRGRRRPSQRTRARRVDTLRRPPAKAQTTPSPSSPASARRTCHLDGRVEADEPSTNSNGDTAVDPYALGPAGLVLGDDVPVAH